MKHLQLELSSLIDLFHEKFLFFLCFLSLIFYQCTIDGKRLYFIGSEVDSPPPAPGPGLSSLCGWDGSQGHGV